MKKLNFGAGSTILSGWDNIDIQKSLKITMSFDFNKFPYPLKDNTYDFIHIDNVLEHLNSPDKVLDELWKKSKNNTIIRIIVPYYNNKGASGSMQHKCYFSDHTFKDYVEERKQIEKKEKYKIKKLILIPTKVGKKMPKKLREKLSLFIGGLISKVYIELKVVK